MMWEIHFSGYNPKSQVNGAFLGLIAGCLSQRFLERFGCEYI